MKANGFIVEKARRSRYSAQTIMDADYASGIALLANIPTQAESLLHRLEQAAGAIGLHVNAEKRNVCALIKKESSSLNSYTFINQLYKG